jgi:hypothetical protein
MMRMGWRWLCGGLCWKRVVEPPKHQGTKRLRWRGENRLRRNAYLSIQEVNSERFAGTALRSCGDSWCLCALVVKVYAAAGEMKSKNSGRLRT